MSWQRVRGEFDALVALSESARADRLEHLAATDRALADELRSLFANDATAGSFLERGPLPAYAAALQPALAMGRRLGRFELVKPLGSGGMASVWEARQSEPARRVAIKLVARSERSDVERWRFHHEVQVLAALNHPAIATFYEAGSDDLDGAEVAWFAMELVEGAADVLTWARTRALDREQRLQLFLRLCDAVEYGHRRGVLHRDLKPGNVLVGSDGQLKLIDFGIAKALAGGAADAAARTLTSHVVGTLQYMSPEQLAGRADAIGTTSDVYALGTMLYELLCDRAPFAFDGVPVARVPALVLGTEPIAPWRARPDLPAELGWIVLRALEKDAARRYQTVAELADDIHNFRAHRPVVASPPSTVYRLRKFVRRHRLAVAVGAVVAAALATGAYGLWRGRVDALASETAALAAGEKATKGERVALRASHLSREVLGVTIDLFNRIDDTEASRDLKVREMLDAASLDDRVERDPAVERAVRIVRATAYDRLQQFASARRELQRAVDLGATLLQRDLDGDEAAAVREEEPIHLARLGRLLVRTGERERGNDMLRDALDASAAAPDRTRMSVLSSWVRCLGEENRDRELMSAAQSLREVAERVGEREQVIQADGWLAKASGMLGDFEAALVAAERAWSGAREHFGDDRTATCQFFARYVTALQEAGEIDRAEQMYPQLLEQTRAAFGADHANVLTTLNNQVQLLMLRGKKKQAIDGMRGIVAVYTARGGTITREHLTALQNLGMVLNQSGRFTEAEPILRDAATASRTVLAPDNSEGAMIRFNHGACLAWMKRWGEAEPILLEEHDRLVKLLPAGHEKLVKARRTIADAYRVNGFPDQEQLWRKKP